MTVNILGDQFFVCLFVFDDVCCYGSSDVTFLLVLAKVVYKVALRVHQVHDDRVVHLNTIILRCLSVA